MRQRVIPMLAPRTPQRPKTDVAETHARGLAVLNSPLLNKGSAFTTEERKALGLTGLLPPEISNLPAQVRRAWIQYARLPDAVSKNNYLTALNNTNEVLFYRLFSEHLREMIPVIGDPADGMTMERYHLECRRRRGVHLSIDNPEAIEEAFANLEAGPRDIDLILATDAEHVTGIGDWGVAGIEVSIGKLAIYAAAGGIDPSRVIPVMLDVGTDRESLLVDPTYSGNRHRRIRGARYDAFLDAYVSVVGKLFPRAVLQWEDFAPGPARRILEKYRHSSCSFNDDMQGTGAITLAAVISAIRICGTPLTSQRVVIFGAGTAGVGIADRIADAMVREGLTSEQAARRFWLVDRVGLLTAGLDALPDYQTAYARSAIESKTWARDEGKTGVGLDEVVRRVKPTILIGASALSGSFTESIVREMASHTERPIIFALSTPPALAEASPSDLITWTGGRALIATGSPFAPVTYKGVTYVVAQLCNAILYPGLSLGAIVSQARIISDGMLAAAANAVSSLVAVRQPGASLLPQIDDLRSVAVTVATAVAEAACDERLARVDLEDIVQQVRDAMWQPDYRLIEAI